MIDWVKVTDRLPDPKKYWVLVFAPHGLYVDDGDQPTITHLLWYKTNFGEFHKDHMKRITHWFPLPDPPDV